MTAVEPLPHIAYANVRDELIAELVALDDATTSQVVPACPDWTVKDVVAHLCGLNAEKLAGVQGSLGIDEATIRQVADRADLSLQQIIDEWQSHAGPIGELMAADEKIAAAFLADLVIHVFDLAEILDQNTTAAAAATPQSSHRYIPLLQKRVAERVSVALSVELADGTTWSAPQDSDGQPVTLTASPHDFIRGVTGRSTRAQVAALGWSADPTSILDTAWNQYGPFRT